MTIEMSGANVFVQVKGLDRAYNRGVRQAFFSLGKALKADARKLIIKGPARGRMYRRKGRNRRASAPGDAPKSQTGNLQRKMAFEIQGSSKMVFGNKARYGGWLEHGTKDKKLLPRPYIAPTVKKNNRNAEKYFANAIERQNSAM